MADNIFSKKEWDKIVDEAFSSNENHIFSENYNNQKAEMERRIRMSRTKKSRKYVTALIAAATAAAIIPTSVLAYNTIANIRRTANYQNTVTIRTPVKSLEATAATDGYMYYEFGWLPDGYEPYEKGYENAEKNETICVQFYKLPDDASVNIDLRFSENYENYISNGKNAMINYRIDYMNSEEENYGRSVYVTFENTSYLLEMLVTDEISRESLLKIIDNVNLVETNEKKYSDYIPWLDDNSNAEYSEPDTKINEKDVHRIGETIDYPFTGKGCNDGYSVTLNSATLTDSFDGITTDACGWEKDFSDIMDENGNVAENIRQKIKLGDGVDNINEVISEESVPMHILKVNVTYTNTSGITNEIVVSPILFIMKDGKPVTHWESSELGYEYRNSILGYYRQSSFFSMDTDSDKKGGKNSVILEPGESADVQIAFFVDEDAKDEVYLDFIVSDNDMDRYFDVRQ